MKPNPEMLFGNFYNDYRITPTYLERHADDVIAKITKGNTGGIFNTVLNPLVAAMIPFKAELGDVDTSVNILLGKTQTVDGFIGNFITFMKDNYINIAGKLNGDKTAAFLEFYPNGKTEYIQITKTKMPTITARLNTAATNNATALGATLTAQLQAFKAQWVAVRDKQLEGKATLKSNREERSGARITVENCLLAVVRFVANKYPSDVEKCMTFFNFNLLFGVYHTGDKGTPIVPEVK
jgi:hypothetical protein